VLSLDERLYLWINGLTGWAPLDSVMAFLVNDYFVPVCLSLALVAMWFAGDGPERRPHLQCAVLWSMAGIGIANIAVKLTNLLFFRERPFAYLPANLLFYPPHDSSFPSNSAAVAFAAAFGIWLGDRKAGTLALLVAALYGFSRIYAGVHFPLDVLGGAAYGLAATLAAYWLFKALPVLPWIAIKLMRVVHLA